MRPTLTAKWKYIVIALAVTALLAFGFFAKNSGWGSVPDSVAVLKKNYTDFSFQAKESAATQLTIIATYTQKKTLMRGETDILAKSMATLAKSALKPDAKIKTITIILVTQNIMTGFAKDKKARFIYEFESRDL